MQKIYLLSGLGADKRVFTRLAIPGELIHIHWLIPLMNENLRQYCQRLVRENKIEDNQILLGVSLGGIVAIEISKLVSSKQVIIISSVKSSREMPLLFKIARYLHVYNFLPYTMLKQPNVFLRFAFSPLSDEDYTLLKKVVTDTDVFFLKWAIRQILFWKAEYPIDNLIHLHGTSDKIFPFKGIKNPIAIKDGGHFMIYNQAAEVSEIISKVLQATI